MKFVILIHSHPQPWGHPDRDYVAENLALPQEQRDQMTAEFEALLTSLQASGELLVGEALADPATYALPVGCRQADRHGRSVRRVQGAVRRVLPDRVADRPRAEEIAEAFAGPGETIELRPAMWPGGHDQ